MGALSSLTNMERRDFDAMVAIVISKRGHCSLFDQSFLVDLYTEFDTELLTSAITQCMANNWFKCAQWKRLANLMVHHGVAQVEWAIDRMQGRENYSIDTVDGILRKEIPAVRKAVVNTKGSLAEAVVAAKKRRIEYPTADHIYNRPAATEWLRQHSHALDTALEFFEVASIDENGNQLYQLKAEYR